MIYRAYCLITADSRDSISDTTMITSICKCIPNFKENAEIIWRAFLCLHQSCVVKGLISRRLRRAHDSIHS